MPTAPGSYSPRPAVLTPLARDTARALGVQIERESQMLKATVTGSVWATRRIDTIPRGAFLEVLTDDGAQLVAFDVLGSGLGERVLVDHGLGRLGLVRLCTSTDRRADHRIARPRA